MPTRRLLPTVVLAAATATLLASCAAGGDYSDLHRERQDGDAIPEAALRDDSTAIPDTSRHVGVHEGTELFLMRDRSDGVCLLVYPDEDGWVTGCGGAELRVSGPGGSFLVLRDGEAPPKGATAVSENVYALAG